MSLLQAFIGFVVNYGGMVVFLITLIANIAALRALKRENSGRARRWVKTSLYTMLVWLLLFGGIIGWAMYQSNKMMQRMSQAPVMEQTIPMPTSPAPEASAPAVDAPAAEPGSSANLPAAAK